MIRRSNGKCIICKELAIYGINFVPRHCETHKTGEDANLVERNCISCNLLMILNSDDKCEYCEPDKFKSGRLAKQNAIMDYLDYRGLKGTSTDITINRGECGLERPDRVYETPSYALIFECDERQHADRQCSCEQIRMVNIGQSFGGLPVYFIRWNPDDYTPMNARSNPDELKKRNKLVGDYIESILEGKTKLPDKSLVSALYMYYDDWNGIAKEPWQTVSAMQTE